MSITTACHVQHPDRHDSYYEILALDGFRLPPAPGSAQRIVDACLELLHRASQA